MLQYRIYRESYSGPHSSFVLASDARRVHAWGRGIQSKGVRVGDKADFLVFTDEAGEGRLEIRAVGPRKWRQKM